MEEKNISQVIKSKSKTKNLKHKPSGYPTENYTDFERKAKNLIHNNIYGITKVTKNSITRNMKYKKKSKIFSKANKINKNNFICFRNHENRIDDSKHKIKINSTLENNDNRDKSNIKNSINKCKDNFINESNLQIYKGHIKNNTFSCIEDYSKKKLSNLSKKKNYQKNFNFKISNKNKNNPSISSSLSKKMTCNKIKIQHGKLSSNKNENTNQKDKKYIKILTKQKLFSKSSENSYKIIETTRPKKLINNKTNTNSKINMENKKSKIVDYKEIINKNNLNSFHILSKNYFGNINNHYLLMMILNSKFINFNDKSESSNDKESKMINYELENLNEQSESSSISSTFSTKKNEVEKSLSQIYKEAKDFLDTSNSVKKHYSVRSNLTKNDSNEKKNLLVNNSKILCQNIEEYKEGEKKKNIIRLFIK